LDQLHNWENPRGYYETLGPEILHDFPDVKMVVGSLGSGGSLFGTGQFLKQKRPKVKIVAVQAASGTKLPGTGAFDDGDYITPFIKEGFDKGIFDHVIKIHEADAVRRSLQLKEQGFFCGLQTGGVMHAALKSAQEFGLEGDAVILSGDSGWKNMDKLLHLM
jgi:cysteine synthase B